MRVSRFFINQPLEAGGNVEVSGPRAHYLRDVLRLKIGDPLTVFNGQGGQYNAEILRLDRNSLTVQVGEHNPIDFGSHLSIDLGLGISKRDAMDVAIQKATELGVSSINPLICANTSISLKAMAKRLDHWREVSYSACEQCGLNRPPEIRNEMQIADWMSVDADLCLIANPHAKQSILEIQAEAKRVAILVGPEGGFSVEEIELAGARQFTEVNLGPRILRTETAVIAMTSLVQSRWGDLAPSTW